MADVKSSTTGPAGDSAAERRRTHRIQITMPVIVRGKSGSHAFEEKTQTVSVNANGCMVRLEARIARGQHVSIVNPKTVEELPCTVTFVGQTDAGKTEIGLEFSEPSPLFWRIAFPPEDWDPSERKRAGTHHAHKAPKEPKRHH
ncbi:MAG TPA: PilZ domain-containing protein [Candidatus Acidoferrales bacterium]|nr:PilZ domain-containing protein [Candidatus Acidoferrales bacterium]